MIVRLVTAAVLFLLSGLALNAQFHTSGRAAARHWEGRLSRSLAIADFTALQGELMRRRPDLGLAESDRTVRSNFLFVVDNQLNQSQMMVPPRAQEVIDHIAKMLSLSQELSDRIAEGRRLAVAHRSGDQEHLPVAVVDGIGEVAGQIRRTFGVSFVELEGRGVALSMPVTESRYGNLVSFLIQADRLQRELDNRLVSYFLSPRPGLVRPDDYRRASVRAISTGLVRLSKLTLDRLRP